MEGGKISVTVVYLGREGEPPIKRSAYLWPIKCALPNKADVNPGKIFIYRCKEGSEEKTFCGAIAENGIVNWFLMGSGAKHVARYKVRATDRRTNLAEIHMSPTKKEEDEQEFAVNEETLVLFSEKAHFISEGSSIRVYSTAGEFLCTMGGDRVHRILKIEITPCREYMYHVDSSGAVCAYCIKEIAHGAHRLVHSSVGAAPASSSFGFVSTKDLFANSFYYRFAGRVLTLGKLAALHDIVEMEYPEDITSVCTDMLQRYVCCGMRDGSVYCTEMSETYASTFKKLKALEGGESAVECFPSGDGNCIYVVGSRRSIVVVNCKEEEVLYRSSVPGEGMPAFVYSVDGDRVLVEV
jgi:hypothetical protein